jgi:hypothetical protein
VTAAAEPVPAQSPVGRITIVSGVLAAVGVAFLIAMFASFATGAKSAGVAFGWINDVLVMLSYLLAAPAVLALRPLLRPRGPILSEVLTVVGLVSVGAIVLLQGLLVIGALTFEEQIGPVSAVYLGLAAWFVLTGYLGQTSGIMPHGVRMGIVGATYIGYPIWAFWMSRRLLRPMAHPAQRRLVIDLEGRPHV